MNGLQKDVYVSTLNHNQQVICFEYIPGVSKPGNSQESMLSQGTNQTPQQNRVLQQLQQGDWRLQQLHHLHHQQQQQQQLLQDAYVQQVLAIEETTFKHAYCELYGSLEHCPPVS